MKHLKKTVILGLLIATLFLASIYSYFEPQSAIGGVYLESKYNPNIDSLQNISEYLHLTNGGYIPHSFDIFLFERLNNSAKDSSEYENILRFYSHQAISSRTGNCITQEGEPYLSSVVELGKSEPTESKQLGYLFLAYGISRKREVYKGEFSKYQTFAKAFNFIELGCIDKIRIEEP